MDKPKRSPTSWSACKAAVKNWPAPGLHDLLHELYKLSPENRRFLHARLLPDATGHTLDESRKAIAKLVSQSAVFNGRFSHAAVKTVIDQFDKATDNPAAVADLLITDLDLSFATFDAVGDHEKMVDHLYATLYRLVNLFESVGPEVIGPLLPRTDAPARDRGRQFGYGISDELTGYAGRWRDRVAGTDQE